jgi:tryptophan 2,3-dioxygenase
MAKKTAKGRPKTGDRRPKTAARKPVPRGMDYPTYLGLDKLLGLQKPLTPGDQSDELLFIVVHQASELWFKVLLHDFEIVTKALEGQDGGLALFQMQRVNELMRIVSAQLASLAVLPPQRFATFRGNLGTSSGSQSVQFRALEAASGLREPWFLELLRSAGAIPKQVQDWLDRPTLQYTFLRFLEKEGVALEQLYLGPGPSMAFFIAEALLEYEMEFAQWRFRHAQLVERMLGPGTSGTGGSQGARFLQTTTNIRFFPKLAEVRARFYSK